MNELKLNETPIRTSRNFLINNIKLTDVEIPEAVEKFKNVEIIGGKNITENIEETKLTYGLGEILQNNIIKNSNSKLKINNYDIQNTYKYNYDFCVENECKVSTNIITPDYTKASNSSLIILDYEFSLDENSSIKNINFFFFYDWAYEIKISVKCQ